MKINNFYQTPKKVGGNSIVRELSEKFGIKKGDIFIFQTDYIYFQKSTVYNNTRFYLKIVGNQNVILMAVKNTNEELIQGNWKVQEILKSLKKKNPEQGNMSIDTLISIIREGRLGVKFNKSISKDHGTIWKYKELNIVKSKTNRPSLKQEKNDDDDFFVDL